MLRALQSIHRCAVHACERRRRFSRQSVEKIMHVVRSPNKSKMAARIDALVDATSDAITPAVLASALWRLNSERDFANTAVAFEWLGDHPLIADNDAALHAALKAYGALKKPITAKDISAGLHDPALAPLTASLVLEAFCASDRLDLVEQCITSWLHMYAVEQSIRGAPHNVHEKIFSLLAALQLKDRASAASPNFLDSLVQESSAYICSVLPSQFAWQALIRLYSGRGAWKQCLAVLDFMEAITPAQFTSPPLTSHTDAPGNPARGLIRVDESMYHHTVRALCACNRAIEALAVISRMRENNFEPGIAMYSHIFRAAVQQLPLQSGGQFETLVDSAVNLLIQHSREPRSSGSYAHFGLVSALVSALCKRGGLADAQLVLDLLSRHGVTYGKEATLTLIHGYSLQGDWKKALELYDTVVERRPGDDDAAVSTAVFPPSNSQKVYHQVARGLRKAGEIEELAKFMLRSSSEGSDSSSSQL